MNPASKPPEPGFIRPEIRALLQQWQEVIALICLAALGLWIAAGSGMIIRGFGYVLVAVALVLLVPTIRRARFRATGSGAGVVKLDEGRILYMGPVTGGAIAIREMTRLSLRVDHQGDRAWILSDPSQFLVIPVDALGSDALFDAFSALPNLRLGQVLTEMDAVQTGTRTLWQRDAALALTD